MIIHSFTRFRLGAANQVTKDVKKEGLVEGVTMEGARADEIRQAVVIEDLIKEEPIHTLPLPIQVRCDGDNGDFAAVCDEI